ncbi:hypothetical protein BDP27DRAFT_1428162 [Rhodocollybia butyracea]|uniref:Uncharacterized protein n=1 Tax=Rhodocollybia butyracea TaxID=206335 RepID=A0A9P5PFI6_9AGAR|nr:hypothetical protein BDP27DRAFT_1428162 [Rhodocollybia butyracea]
MLSRDEMADISNKAKQIFWQVGRIDPLDPETSPGTKSSYKEMLKTVAQAAGQTLAAAVGLSQSITEDDGDPPNLGLTAQEWHNLGSEPESSEEDTDPEEQPRHLIEDELGEIFNGTEDDGGDFFHYTLDQFIAMVLKEDMRESYSALEIVRRLNDFLLPFSLCSLGNRVRAIQSQAYLCLSYRQDFSKDLGASSEDSLTLYLLGVIRNIEGIKALEDWNAQSYAFQKEFRLSFARSLYPRQFSLIDNLAVPRKEKTRRYNKLAKPVRTKLSKFMEQRQRFLTLYIQFGPSSYGPYIHEDGRQERFSTHVKKVPSNFQGGHQAALEVMGGTRVAEYVSDFLNENLYWDWDGRRKNDVVLPLYALF